MWQHFKAKNYARGIKNDGTALWLRLLIHFSKHASLLTSILLYLLEETMHYKTIALELIQQHPKMQSKLRMSRSFLPIVEHYARQLKKSHEVWKDRLTQTMPRRNESQIASEALEIALKEMENSFHLELLTEDSETVSIEEIMAFIRRRTPPA
jgi:hypothetical protein